MMNLRQSFYRLYSEIESQEHRLLYLFLEITRKCNLSCLHCGSDCKKESGMAELSAESWKNVIRYMCSHFSKELAFVFTGGEPLVSKDLESIGYEAAKRGHPWGTVTNGILLTEERMKKLIDSGISAITLSLDGTQKNHNFLRNHEHAYEKVLSALEHVGKSSIPSRDAVTCVFASNLGELDSIAEVLIDKGIPSWRLFPIFPSGRAKENKSLTMTKEQRYLLLDWIIEKRPYFKKRGLDINFSCEGYLPFKLDRKVRNEPYFCRAGINIAAILADGTITGCNNNQPPFYQGSILENDFKEVWENRFELYRNKELLKKGKCATCKEWRYCKGNSIHLWHNLEKGPEFCYLK